MVTFQLPLQLLLQNPSGFHVSWMPLGHCMSIKHTHRLRMSRPAFSTIKGSHFLPNKYFFTVNLYHQEILSTLVYNMCLGNKFIPNDCFSSKENCLVYYLGQDCTQHKKCLIVSTFMSLYPIQIHSLFSMLQMHTGVTTDGLGLTFTKDPPLYKLAGAHHIHLLIQSMNSCSNFIAFTEAQKHCC